MKVRVAFYSYFKDLTGCPEIEEDLPSGARISDLIERLAQRFPNWAPARGCALIAVGVEYQKAGYILQERDEVSFFPPVQGG